MNSIMERWIGGCRRELLDRTLIWNQRHLMIVLREYEDFYNTHRPHRALSQAAPPAIIPAVDPSAMNLEESREVDFSIAPRSMVVLAPISQSSPTRTPIQRRSWARSSTTWPPKS